MIDGQIDFAVDSFPDTSGTIAIVACSLTGLCMLYCIFGRSSKLEN